jgi:hypothetical protein
MFDSSRLTSKQVTLLFSSLLLSRAMTVPTMTNANNNDAATVSSEADFTNQDVEVAAPPAPPKIVDTTTSSSTSPVQKPRRRNIWWIVALSLMTLTAVVVFVGIRVSTQNKESPMTTSSAEDTASTSTSIVPPADPNTVYWKVTSKQGDYYHDQCVIAADNARCIESHDSTGSVLESYGSLTCAIECTFEVAVTADDETTTELHVEYFDTRASVDKMTLHGLAYSGRPLQFFDYPMEQGDTIDWHSDTRSDMDDTKEKGWRICLI